MIRRSWIRRAWIGAGLALVANIVLALTTRHHSVLLVSLIVLALVAVAATVNDSMRGISPLDWSLTSDGVDVAPQTEVSLAGYQRLLDSHRSSRQVDSRLQRRLLGLAEDRLRLLHGLTPDRDAEEVRARLGPDLLALSQQPPRRLSSADIARIIQRIEEL